MGSWLSAEDSVEKLDSIERTSDMLFVLIDLLTVYDYALLVKHVSTKKGCVQSLYLSP